MWHNNRKVVRTHAKNGSRMAWAIIGGLGGWIRVRTLSPDGVTNIFMILCTALANGRNVDVCKRNGVIDQATLR
ncbi:MAG: hypothetical protein JSV16_01860 [Candidatus Hydrogenedentota bacterium]|nr:MAG: hypothetical protein JSV16_01860 [Candidatus Hydrogenedentota bacterium]